MKLLYRLVYTDIIRRLRAKGWGTQRINTVLAALGLPETKEAHKKIKLPFGDI